MPFKFCAVINEVGKTHFNSAAQHETAKSLPTLLTYPFLILPPSPSANFFCVYIFSKVFDNGCWHNILRKLQSESCYSMNRSHKHCSNTLPVVSAPMGFQHKAFMYHK